MACPSCARRRAYLRKLARITADAARQTINAARRAAKARLATKAKV